MLIKVEESCVAEIKPRCVGRICVSSEGDQSLSLKKMVSHFLLIAMFSVYRHSCCSVLPAIKKEHHFKG